MAQRLQGTCARNPMLVRVNSVLRAVPIQTLIEQAREQVVKLLTTDWLMLDADVPNGGCLDCAF